VTQPVALEKVKALVGLQNIPPFVQDTELLVPRMQVVRWSLNAGGGSYRQQ
jgi:hypothetical protein